MDIKVMVTVTIISNKIEAKRDSSIFGIELNSSNLFTNTFEGEIADLSLLNFQSTRVKVPVIKDDKTMVYPYYDQITAYRLIKLDSSNSGSKPWKVTSDEITDDLTYINPLITSPDIIIYQNSLQRYLYENEYSILSQGGLDLVNDIPEGDFIVITNIQSQI